MQQETQLQKQGHSSGHAHPSRASARQLAPARRREAAGAARSLAPWRGRREAAADLHRRSAGQERGGAESPPPPVWSGRRHLPHLRRSSRMGEGVVGRPQSSRTSSSAAGRASTSSSTAPDLGSSARAGSWDLGSTARAESWELRPLHVLREGRPSTPTSLDDDELDAGGGAAFASYEIPPPTAPRIHRFTSSVPDSGERGRGSRLPCSVEGWGKASAAGRHRANFVAVDLFPAAPLQIQNNRRGWVRGWVRGAVGLRQGERNPRIA
jgi:hypothetical protein